MTYERIGGQAVADAALDDFFRRAKGDDLLAHLITPAGSPGVRAFLAAALALEAGDEDEDEDGLAPALDWLSEAGPEDEDLDHMIGHLALALEAHGLDDELIAEVADHAEQLRDLALGVWPEDDEDDEEDEEAAA